MAKYRRAIRRADAHCRAITPAINQWRSLPRQACVAPVVTGRPSGIFSSTPCIGRCRCERGIETKRAREILPRRRVRRLSQAFSLMPCLADKQLPDEACAPKRHDATPRHSRRRRIYKCRMTSGCRLPCFASFAIHEWAAQRASYITPSESDAGKSRVPRWREAVSSSSPSANPRLLRRGDARRIDELFRRHRGARNDGRRCFVSIRARLHCWRSARASRNRYSIFATTDIYASTAQRPLTPTDNQSAHPISAAL